MTDRCGRDGEAGLPFENHHQFHANADLDEDAFKIEVLETRPVPGNTPEQTAERIRDEINKIADLSAQVSVNPPEAGDPHGSADLLIRDSFGGRVTITNLSETH